MVEESGSGSIPLTNGSGSGSRRIGSGCATLVSRGVNETFAGLGYSAAGWDGHAMSPVGFKISVLNYQAV
jgi:hypothetical protein